MVRSKWKRTLLTSFAWAGMALSQVPTARADAPVDNTGRIMTVQEMGKPGQKCVVVRSWVTPDGVHAYEVQNLGTHEMLTIVESGPLNTQLGNKVRAMATRIFHWGQGNTRPVGVPVPPQAMASSDPKPALVQSSSQTVVQRPSSAPAPAVAPRPLQAMPASRPLTEQAHVSRPTQTRSVSQPVHPPAVASGSASPYAPLLTAPSHEQAWTARPVSPVIQTGGQSTRESSAAPSRVIAAAPARQTEPAAMARMPEGPPLLPPAASVQTLTAPAATPVKTSANQTDPAPVQAKAATSPIIKKDATGTVQYLRAPLFPPAPRTVAQATPNLLPGPVCNSALPAPKPVDRPAPQPAHPVTTPIVQASARTEVVSPVTSAPGNIVHSTAPLNLPPGEDRIISVTETSIPTPTTVHSETVHPIASPSHSQVISSRPVVVQEGPALPAQPMEVHPASPIRHAAVSPPAMVVVQPAQTADFRESWGKPVPQDADTRVTGGLPHASYNGHDPLLNEPQKYGPEPGPTRVTSLATPASAAADPSGPMAMMPEEAQPKPQRRWRLFGNLGRRAPENQQNRATAQQTMMAAPSQPAKTVPPAAALRNDQARGPVQPPAKAPSEPARMASATAPAVANQAAPNGNGTPMGVGSVVAAHNGVAGPVQFVPVPVVTLPGTTRPPQAKLPEPPRPLIPEAPHPNGPVQASGPSDGTNSMLVNAFTPEPDANQEAMAGPFGSNHGMGGYGPMMPPAYARGPAMPPVPYGPVAAIGANRQGMASPVPSMYATGTPAYGPGGNLAAPGPYAPRMPVQGGTSAAMGPRGQGLMPVSYQGGTPTSSRTMPANQSLAALQPQSAPQLLNMLQDSLYPSHREWAADNLASCDWRTHPHVVQALVLAAGKDPAATVRAGCVRALARMNVNTVPVITAVQALKTDADPRVRHEVEQALATLIPAGAEK